MRVTSTPIGTSLRDPDQHSRSGKQTANQLAASNHARIVDTLDLSPQHTRSDGTPAWLKTYLALLPDDVAAERTRQAFGKGEDGMLDRLLFEIL